MSAYRRLVCCLVVLIVLPGLTVYAQEDKISLSLQDAEFAQIFQTLGRLQNMNVVVDPSVTGRSTLELEDVPFMEALEIVAGLGGYDYRILGNTLVVATPERLRHIDRLDVEGVRFIQVQHIEAAELERALSLVMPRENMYIQPESGLVILIGSQEALGRAEEIIAALDKPAARQPPALETVHPALAEPQDEAGGYQVKVYRLNYADPETTRVALSLIIDEARMRIDPDSKGIIVRATAAELQEIDAFLKEFDQPIAQVVLEVWVQEMTADALRSLGIDWESPVSFSGGTTPPRFYELAYEPWNLFLALRALEDQGKAKLLANPKISTLSGKEASIFVGDRVPIVLRNEEGVATGIEYLEAGINLEVLPRVSDDGNITIQVRPEVSSFIWQAGSQYPQIRTREAHTMVRVKSGQPVVIGGLLQEEDMELLVQIPILSQLPILGELFKWRETQTQQTEMTIFLIPRLVGTEEDEEEAFFTSAQ